MSSAEQEEFFGPKEKFSIKPSFIVVFIVFILLIGSFFMWNFFLKSRLSAQASPIIINTPQENAVSDWKIYTNEKYDFSFKYPTEWAIKNQATSPNSASIVFVNSNVKEAKESQDYFRVTVFESLAKLDYQKLNPTSLKDYLDKYAALPEPIYKDITTQEIANFTGFKVLMGPNQKGGGLAYLVQIDNGPILGLRFFADGATDDQISSIIKNIKIGLPNQVELKTYTNNDLKFEFQYPKAWQDIQLNELVQDATLKNHGKGFSSLYKQGSAVPVYFDPESFFGFNIFSIDYNGSPFGAVGPKKVDLNWAQEQFVENMKLPYEVLGYKKIGNNGVLVLDYAVYECSPVFNANIYIPTQNLNYPNLIINFNLGNMALDQTVKDYVAIQTKAGKDACQTKEAFQLIADKILAGTYSDKINDQIKTAQIISDSFKNL